MTNGGGESIKSKVGKRRCECFENESSARVDASSTADDQTVAVR